MYNPVLLKIPPKLQGAAMKFADEYGYRNLQELIYESLREKVFGKNKYDESFTEGEIKLIENILDKSLSKRKVVGESKLRKALSK
jgi:hypothetical protein